MKHSRVHDSFAIPADTTRSPHDWKHARAAVHERRVVALRCPAMLKIGALRMPDGPPLGAMNPLLRPSTARSSRSALGGGWQGSEPHPCVVFAWPTKLSTCCPTACSAKPRHSPGTRQQGLWSMGARLPARTFLRPMGAHSAPILSCPRHAREPTIGRLTDRLLWPRRGRLRARLRGLSHNSRTCVLCWSNRSFHCYGSCRRVVAASVGVADSCGCHHLTELGSTASIDCFVLARVAADTRKIGI